jgi:hypothetical protein
MLRATGESTGRFVAKGSAGKVDSHHLLGAALCTLFCGVGAVCVFSRGQFWAGSLSDRGCSP